jgi:hypothetical protein
MTEPTGTGTGKSPKPSDGYTRKFKDRKKSKEESMVGAMETFGSLIYKINSKDAAEMYHDTTEAIVDYVTITYGKDMQNLVKYGVDRNLIMPSPPPEAERKKDKFLEVKWKADYDEYLKERKLYDKEKTQVFGIVLGQCSKMVRDELTKDERFKDIEMGSDVAGLMEILREMVHSNVGRIEPNWAMVQVLKQVLSLHQQKNDSITHYHKKFASATKVLKTQWGPFYPPKLVKDTPEPSAEAGSNRAAADGDDEEASTESRPPDAATAKLLAKAREDAINEAQEAFLTAIFLYNADKSRFRGLQERLNNDYLAGSDKYPKTLAAATNLLTYNQDNQTKASKTKKGWEDDGGRETSFAQTGKGKPKRGSRPPPQATNPDEEQEPRTLSRRNSNRSQTEGWTS